MLACAQKLKNRGFRAGVGQRAVAADLLLHDASRRMIGMHDRERLHIRHDAAVRVAAAEAEHHHVAGRGASTSQRVIKHEAEISFLAAMQMPIGRIGPRFEWRTQPGIDKHPHQQHAAIDADALDVGAIVIRRADPGAGLGDDRRALRGFVARNRKSEIRSQKSESSISVRFLTSDLRLRFLASDRHLRRRHVGKAAEVREIVELALAGARRVVAAVIDGEAVTRRRQRSPTDRAASATCRRRRSPRSRSRRH